MAVRQRKSMRRRGSILALTVVLVLVLTLTGVALLSVAEGQLLQAVRVKNQEAAFSAAEAAYEQALFWMSQQVDMLESLGHIQSSGTLEFPTSRSDYSIRFTTFLGARPVYKIEANGYSGIFQRTVSAYVVQAVSGWEMGMCRIPSGPNSTIAVNFVSGEIIDFPMHINDLKDSPDNRDIYISGSPDFRAHVSMGESRYRTSGADKYGTSIINLFPAGISFNQPASLITNPTSVDAKINRFRDATNVSYRFSPQIVKSLPKHSQGRNGFYSSTVSEAAAVHLKFYVKDGAGYVRIYDDCTVATYTRSGTASNSYDYSVNTQNNSNTYWKYPIYGCHYTTGSYTDVRIDDPESSIYVSQLFGGVESDPGAQIYVDGNVIIGASQEDSAVLGSMLNTVKGRLAIVASGNIWLTNELKVDGPRDVEGMPTLDNLNVLGLISQGVIKVVDPGMTDNNLLSNQAYFNAAEVAGYEPIGLSAGSQPYNRVLPGTVVVEASMTVGGGGWGAENLYRSSSFPGRKNFNGSKNDNLVVRGSLTEVMRGVVGSGTNGYLKKYYYDKRVMTGIFPGNIWLKGKYVLIPGGWTETSTINQD